MYEVTVVVSGHPVAQISSKYKQNVSNIMEILEDYLEDEVYFITPESDHSMNFICDNEEFEV